eukprot:m51a1_g4048 hypothetical protein (348) ;mRNA; f:692592-694094
MFLTPKLKVSSGSNSPDVCKDIEAALQEARSRREKHMEESLPQWKEIVANWDKHKDKDRTKKLWWMGLPPSMRGTLWTLVLPNELNITDALYDMLVKQARATKKRIVAESGGTDGGMILGKMGSVKLIPVDLNRTFAPLRFFQEGGPYQGTLRDVLEAYVFFRPDLGYVQGMSYLTAMLLLNMEGPKAFCTLANLLNKPLLRSFFNMNAKEIDMYVAAFERVMDETLPKVSRNMRCRGVGAQIFLIEWVMTIFSKSLPIDVATRIWDTVMLEGEYMIFRAGLGILSYFSPVLTTADFDVCISTVQNLPEDLDADAIMASIAAIPLTEKKYSAAVAACMTDLATATRQ